MRITIVLGPFHPVPTVLGGAVEKVQLALAREYAALGHTVTVMSRRYRDFPHIETVDGVRHVRIRSCDRTSSLPLNLVNDLRYALRASRALAPSDVTVTNSFSLPLVLSRRTAGRIYVHVARFPKHQMLLYRRADRLQAVSTAVAEAIGAQTPSVAARVVTIGNPVSDAFFGADRQRPRSRTVLYVGRIAREKGLHLLLQAFRRAAAECPGDRWTLRIVGPHEPGQGGDGDAYFRELRELAAPLGSACEFVGPIFDERELVHEYRAASVFVYPSLAEHGEAFGLSVLEAMAAGCAVITSDLRCFDDYLRTGANGLRFNHRAADAQGALAEQLLRLMTNADLLCQIAAGGHETAGRYRTSAIAARMLADFEAVTNPVR